MNSKEKLINGLLELLNIKDFMDITISELCIVSKVHRTTFYAYFENMFDLLETTKEFCINKFLSEVKNINENDDYINKPLLISYLNFIKQNSKLFLAYINNGLILGSDKNFEKLFENIIFPKAREKGAKDENSILYISKFYIEGIMAIVKLRLSRSCLESEVNIADLIISLKK